MSSAPHHRSPALGLRVASEVRLGHGGTRALLARIHADPQLPATVRALPAVALAGLVRSVGLEDAGEIVALASPEQLLRVLDEDAWRGARPGDDESLDPRRFALWLEVLAESGPEVAARQLLALPAELVLHGLAELTLVIDIDRLGETMAGLGEEDADHLDKALGDALHLEIDGWRVIARADLGWDALAEVLLALDAGHRDELERILDRLAIASGELHDDPEQLHRVLRETETIAEDAAADREQRRAAEGHVAAADARAFLRLARTSTLSELQQDTRSDPVVRAWMRELAPAPTPAPLPGEARALLAALQAAEQADAPQPPAARTLPSPVGQRARRGRAFQAALRRLATSDPRIHAQRLEELAFLVNVLVAGGVVTRPAEAADRVAEVCGRGLARWRLASRAGGAAMPRRLEVLRQVSADRLFRAGYGQRGPSSLIVVESTTRAARGQRASRAFSRRS